MAAGACTTRQPHCTSISSIKQRWGTGILRSNSTRFLGLAGKLIRLVILLLKVTSLLQRWAISHLWCLFTHLLHEYGWDERFAIRTQGIFRFNQKLCIFIVRWWQTSHWRDGKYQFVIYGRQWSHSMSSRSSVGISFNEVVDTRCCRWDLMPYFSPGRTTKTKKSAWKTALWSSYGVAQNPSDHRQR